MFDLKKPCDTCPFRLGNFDDFDFCQERFEEIVNAPSFQCHKTVEYGEDEFGEPITGQGDNPQQCFGLMSVLAKSGLENQIMQVAERLGCLDVSKLAESQETYSGVDELREKYEG
jgi:hypothetical protein